MPQTSNAPSTSSRTYHRTLWFAKKFGKKSWA